MWNLRPEGDIPVWGCDETIERGGALRTACALKVGGVKTKGFSYYFPGGVLRQSPALFFGAFFYA